MYVPGAHRVTAVMLPPAHGVPGSAVRIDPHAGRSWRHVPGATASGRTHTTSDLNGFVWWSGRRQWRAVQRDVSTRFPGQHSLLDTTRTRALGGTGTGTITPPAPDLYVTAFDADGYQTITNATATVDASGYEVLPDGTATRDGDGYETAERSN